VAALLLAGSLGAQIPEIPYDSAPNFLKLPEHVYLGEAAGVATDSRGNIFVALYQNLWVGLVDLRGIRG
jgi:hypothetical protein